MAHTFAFFEPPVDGPSDRAGASTGIEKNDFQIATMATFMIPATKRSMPVTMKTGLRLAITATTVSTRPRMAMATDMFRAWATALAHFDGSGNARQTLPIGALT